MLDFSKASLNELIAKGGHACACGRVHRMDMDLLSHRRKRLFAISCIHAHPAQTEQSSVSFCSMICVSMRKPFEIRI